MSDRGASAELVSLGWERIQLSLRLRPSGAVVLDPQGLRLRREADPAVAIGPTRAFTDQGDVVARVNVMQGPGQMPLAPGRWVFALAGGREASGPPLTVRAADGLDVAGQVGRFATERGEYAVRPLIAGDGSLVLEISLDPTVRPPDALRRSRLKRVVRPLRNRLFLLLFGACRLVARRNGRRILFIAHYGTDLSGDMRVILERMAERGLDRTYELCTIPPIRVRRSRDWLRLPWQLARADIVVIDEDVLRIFERLPARVIQLWHASGAIKTIGYSRIGKPNAVSPWGRDYKYFTYAIVSGEHDVPLFAEAFGIPEARVVPTGHPRMDRFFDEAYRARAREATLEAFPAARGRLVILFAPTWRQARKGRVYDLGVLDLARVHELCLEKDAVFIIRLHPTVRHPVEIPAPLRDRVLDGSTSVMDAPDLLCATDLLITDYSSIILEYALLGRPMLFFPYDLAEYKAERDVYMPYDEFVPGRIAPTFDALLEAIRREDYEVEKVAPFAERHFSHRDGGATDRVIDLILGT